MSYNNYGGNMLSLRNENFLALASTNDQICNYLPKIVFDENKFGVQTEETLQGLRWDTLFKSELALRFHLEIALETLSQVIEILYKFGVLLTDRRFTNVFVMPWLELSSDTEQVFRLQKWLVKQIDFGEMFNFSKWDKNHEKIKFGVGESILNKTNVEFENINHASAAQLEWNRFLKEFQTNIQFLVKDKETFDRKFTIDEVDFTYLEKVLNLIASIKENEIYSKNENPGIMPFYYLNITMLKKSIVKINKLQEELASSLNQNEQKVVFSFST